MITASIEKMLQNATGRDVRGSFGDVTLRIVSNSTFCQIAGVIKSFDARDLGELSKAIVCVISSDDIDGILSIRCTIPGVSTDSSRLEFARQYASELFHETPVQDVVAPGSGFYVQRNPNDLSHRFEEFLVAAILLYRVDLIDGEQFLMREFVPKLSSFCAAIGHPERMGAVCEGFMLSMCNVESDSGY